MIPKITAVQVSELYLEKIKANPLNYIYEQKFDGWRCLAIVENGSVILQTKSGLKHRGFNPVRRELLKLGLEEAVFDGEIVCLNQQGRPDFKKLMKSRQEVTYCVFDVLWLYGYDLRPHPLMARKELLAKIFPKTGEGIIRRVPHYQGIETYKLGEETTSGDLEGMVAKLKDAPYDPDLRANWVKVLNTDYTQTRGRREWFAKIRKP